VTPSAPPPPQAPLTAAERAVIAGAERALLDEHRLLSGDELTALAALPDGAVMALASLAHQVRLDWCGPEVEIEGILSAKTGGCPEDCHFCPQSSRFDTPVKATPFLDTDEVLAAARETAALGASEFCIVLAVRGPDERTMQRLLDLVPLIGNETGLNVAVSAGVLTEDQATRLAAGGVHRYNHNVPLGERPIVGAWEAVRWIALFRLALPSVILRYAGGREVTLRDLQAIGMTAGINALIVGNYLTTLGRSSDEDLQMLADLRMPIGALTAAI
jgi:biotin synthase-like enzyme